MRGATAKALRREAEKLTIKLPARRLVTWKQSGALVNYGCTRAQYRALKRLHKKAKL